MYVVQSICTVFEDKRVSTVMIVTAGIAAEYGSFNRFSHVAPICDFKRSFINWCFL